MRGRIPLKILTWNIQQGGSDKRIPQIAEELQKHAPDVLVASKFNSSRQIVSRLSPGNELHDLVL